MLNQGIIELSRRLYADHRDVLEAIRERARSRYGSFQQHASARSLQDQEEALRSLEADADFLHKCRDDLHEFNIFGALKISTTEIRHSNCLGWMLDPDGSHRGGDVFLRAFLSCLPAGSMPKGFIHESEGGPALGAVRVRREWNGIDLLIDFPELQYLVAIENKVLASEHGKQLAKYTETLESNFPNYDMFRVFVTPQGVAASRPDWFPLSLRVIAGRFEQVLADGASDLHRDAQVLINHYLRTVRQDVLDEDQRRDTVADQLIGKHSLALAVLLTSFDEQSRLRTGSTSTPTASLMQQLALLIGEQLPQWKVAFNNHRHVGVVPDVWVNRFPEIGAEQKWFHWLRVSLENHGSEIRSRVVAGPTNDPEMRSRAILRLTRDPKEFGLERPKGLGGKICHFGELDVTKWLPGREPIAGEVFPELQKHLERRYKVLSQTTDAILAACRGED